MAPDEPLESLKSQIPQEMFLGLADAGKRLKAEIDIVYRPLVEQTGLSLQELLLYLLSEQITELRRVVAAAVAKGIAVHVAGQIFERREGDEGPLPGDEWKRDLPPRNNDEEDDGS